MARVVLDVSPQLILGCFGELIGRKISARRGERCQTSHFISHSWSGNSGDIRKVMIIDK